MDIKNNTLKPLKDKRHKELYGVYAEIYYKHIQKQRITYGIIHPSYRSYYNIPKETQGKSRYYI